MLPLSPEDRPEYVCSNCDSTFENDRYLCPVCGTLTLERRPATDA
jgi:rRNA maturation endonuclease Nob1